MLDPCEYTMVMKFMYCTDEFVRIQFYSINKLFIQRNENQLAPKIYIYS